MQKDIGTFIIAYDEAKPPRRVEPFDRPMDLGNNCIIGYRQLTASHSQRAYARYLSIHASEAIVT